jgi:hypothetical protein
MMIHMPISLAPLAVTILDGNVGPDLGDIGDGVEIGAMLPGDESGPDFTYLQPRQH